MAASESALEEDGQHVSAGTAPRGEDDIDESLEPPVRTRFENNRADAVTLMAESFLQSGADAVKTANRYQVVIHVDEAVLSYRCELVGGPAIASDTARRLCCDSGLLVAKENNIGRKSRSIPPAMHRALQDRDKGCRFPGCTATRFVDDHHIKHWADGGETDMSNLVLLCRHHHRKVHEEGFNVQLI